MPSPKQTKRDCGAFQLPMEKVVARAMSVLSSIFGAACPPAAKEAVVTIWHKDAFSTGCYSYMDKDAIRESSIFSYLFVCLFIHSLFCRTRKR